MPLENDRPGRHPRSRQTRWGVSATTVALVALLSAACQTPAPSTAEGASDAPTAVPRVGRSICPGSVPQVLRQVDGAAADTLEELQGTYQNDPGFLGVVHDGRKAVIVVESGRLLEWHARMAPLGVAVAMSCVDPGLLASVQAALPLISEREEGVMSAGYDVLDDAITVLGVDPDELVRTLDEIAPGSESAALAAIAAGTLRIDPRAPAGSRLAP